MGALLDKSQRTAFYFGNAERDLAHLMPVGDEEAVSSINATELIQSLDRAANVLNDLIEKRKALGYVIADLKRIIS